MARAENQFSTPSRSSRMLLAAFFICGTLDCMTHERARSSPAAASSREAHEYTARTASTIAQGARREQVLGGERGPLVRLALGQVLGALRHTYFVPLSSRRFSSQLFASAHLVFSSALLSSCITWNRSTVWAARGMASAQPSE